MLGLEVGWVDRRDVFFAATLSGSGRCPLHVGVQVPERSTKWQVPFVLAVHDLVLASTQGSP